MDDIQTRGTEESVQPIENVFGQKEQDQETHKQEVTQTNKEEQEVTERSKQEQEVIEISKQEQEVIEIKVEKQELVEKNKQEQDVGFKSKEQVATEPCGDCEDNIALVVASAPECHQDELISIMKTYQKDQGIYMQKAFGRAGDMVDTLDGNGWVGKWQTKVVMAVATMVNMNQCTSAIIFCIEGGPHCDKELAHQPLLVKAIRQELGVADFDVSVEWMSFKRFKNKASRGTL
mmetsp:Transcript_8025/g.10370  ORF Transcript_8025/g.10370 Transcript_8025/m.10370 type:complete len:233 (+) Transcript_8025:33-731(+)